VLSTSVLLAVEGICGVPSNAGDRQHRESDGESSGDLALDPTNQLALANLENFYNWLRAPEPVAKIEPGFAMSSEEIDIQLAKVRAIAKIVPIATLQPRRSMRLGGILLEVYTVCGAGGSERQPRRRSGADESVLSCRGS